MLDKLKADFDGILELVNKTPPALQETAFKMILEKWFATNALPPPLPSPPPGTPAPPAPSGVQTGVPDAVKPFLTANAITTEILEKVFHPAGPGAQLLASEIPGTGKAAKVIALSLLLCVKQALESGSFTCTLKYLREMAIHYDCYDSPNFSTTLKANKNYYKPREKGADLDGRWRRRRSQRPEVPERVAMQLTGHKTRSVIERYNIVSEGRPTRRGKEDVSVHEQSMIAQGQVRGFSAKIPAAVSWRSMLAAAPTDTKECD